MLLVFSCECTLAYAGGTAEGVTFGVSGRNLWPALRGVVGSSRGDTGEGVIEDDLTTGEYAVEFDDGVY